MASSVLDKDRGWKRFQKQLKKFGDLEVVVGIPGEIDFTVPNTAAIGMVHEFGSEDDRIPERSFIRSTFDVNQKKYGRMLDNAVERFVKATNKEQARKQGLFKLGETARQDVINRIRDREIRQELAQSTIDRKGSETALIDTGALVGSIVSIVRKTSA